MDDYNGYKLLSPHSQILILYQMKKKTALFKLKAFANDNFNVTQNIKFVSHSIEHIVRKRENAGYQRFLLFPQYFQKAFHSGASNFVIRKGLNDPDKESSTNEVGKGETSISNFSIISPTV